MGKIYPSMKYDVAVIGGGTAGVPAAIQAARAGAKTLLIEKNSILGGTITAGGVNFPGIFHAWGKQVISGIGWELVSQTLELAGDILPNFSDHKLPHWKHQVRINRNIYALLCEEATLAAGSDILYHTMLAKIERDGDGWRMQICGKEGLRDIFASAVVDCSGDANAASLAGFEVRVPDELQPATLICTVSGYDPKKLDMQAIDKSLADELAKGNLRPLDLSWNVDNASAAGWLNSRGRNANHIHCPGARDSRQKNLVELESRSVLLKLYRFLKQQPGLESLNLDDMALECGIRETATIAGEETITLEDYWTGRRWPDSICHAFYPVDLHTESGCGLDIRRLSEGVVPSIPLRALLPKQSQRFVVAGRCLSSDRLANSGLRVQASCMAMGQAAGAWAALTAKSKSGMVELDCLKQLLVKHNAIVPD